jgi:hypothetical protein
MAKRDVERYGTMTDLATALGLYLRCCANTPEPLSFTIPPVLLSPSNDAQPDNRAAPNEPEVNTGAGQWDGRTEVRSNEGPVALLAPADLLRSWHQWTAIVASFALRRRSRRYRDPQAYLTLRKQLLATLGARIAEVDGQERDFYLWVEALISPWVSTRSLAQQDKEILCDLLARCRLVDRILKHRSRDVAAGRTLAAVSVVLAAVSALLCWGFVIR